MCRYLHRWADLFGTCCYNYTFSFRNSDVTVMWLKVCRLCHLCELLSVSSCCCLKPQLFNEVDTLQLWKENAGAARAGNHVITKATEQNEWSSSLLRSSRTNPRVRCTPPSCIRSWFPFKTVLNYKLHIWQPSQEAAVLCGSHLFCNDFNCSLVYHGYSSSGWRCSGAEGAAASSGRWRMTCICCWVLNVGFRFDIYVIHSQ